jgi:hypothetical protein
MFKYIINLRLAGKYVYSGLQLVGDLLTCVASRPVDTTGDCVSGICLGSEMLGGFCRASMVFCKISWDVTDNLGLRYRPVDHELSALLQFNGKEVSYCHSSHVSRG